LRSLVETWQGECGFDALGLVVLFALEMIFLDGFNGALVDGIMRRQIVDRPPIAAVLTAFVALIISCSFLLLS
jgi:hypothetical protein